MGRLVRRYIRAFKAKIVDTLTVGANDITNAVIAAAAGKKIVYGETSITGTGDITATELTTVEQAFVNVKNSGTAIPTRTASITGIATNVISVVVTEHATSANSVASVAAAVAYIAIGT